MFLDKLGISTNESEQRDPHYRFEPFFDPRNSRPGVRSVAWGWPFGASLFSRRRSRVRIPSGLLVPFLCWVRAGRRAELTIGPSRVHGEPWSLAATTVGEDPVSERGGGTTAPAQCLARKPMIAAFTASGASSCM